MVANDPPIINSEDVYFLTLLGQSELAAAGTSLSPSELELLVLIDGKATVSQLQASAEHFAPGEVIKVLDKLLRSERIALKLFDLGDFFGASAPSQWKGEMPSDRAIARGVSTLQQDGYIARIARRPPSEPKRALDKEFTVMVVEDERQLAENMRMVLSLAGFVARVAANREQIIAAFRQPPLPDLVLLDVMLPDTDGFNVLARMRQHPMLREVPVIMVTGTATREAVLKGLQGGANGYITKPFHIDVLVKAVKTVLGIEASDQEAVLGNIPSAAESAPPGRQAIPAMHPAAAPVAPATPSTFPPAHPAATPVAPATPSTLPPAHPAAAPVAPATPSTFPPAHPAATPVAPATPSTLEGSSRLARLRQLAQAKQAEQQKPDVQPEIDARVSRAVEKAYQYLKEFTDQINIVKPAYPKEYAIAGIPNFDGLLWDQGNIFLRTRESTPTTKLFDQFTLEFRLSASKQLRVVRDSPEHEKLKQVLLDNNIAFSSHEERNERGTVVRASFVIPCEVKAILHLAGNFKTGKLLLRTRNVERFGLREHVVAPEAITDESLDELTGFILGESDRIGPLLLKDA